MTLEELYDKLGLKGDDRCGEGVVGQHLLNVNAIKLQRERAERAEEDVDGGLKEEVANLRAYEDKWHAEMAKLKADLAKRPWIDGPHILQGEHEADIGQVGYTVEAYNAAVLKAQVNQREACAQFIEQAAAKEVGLGLRRNLVHAERCRATPLVK